MLPLISFETGRRTQTQSSEQPAKAETANGSLVLSQIETTAKEANTRGEEPEKNYTRAPPEARRESSCPLDKDLSWKSGNRTCGSWYPCPETRLLFIRVEKRTGCAHKSFGTPKFVSCYLALSRMSRKPTFL